MNERKNLGITLIALIVTIIVILILVGITISALTGENGIISQAITAKEMWEEASEKERIAIAKYEDQIEGSITDGMWKIYLNTTIYSTNIKINVKSKYNKIPSTLNGYKELYIIDFLNYNNSFKYEFESLDDFIIEVVSMESSKIRELNIRSIDELIEIFKQETEEDITRDQLVYSLFLNTEDREQLTIDNVLLKIGYNEEKIREIELEYEEKKAIQIEIPEKYKNKTYIIIYPDGTQEILEGKDLATYKGEYNVNENNTQYSIKIAENEGTEKVLNINVKNYVKHPLYEDEYYEYRFGHYYNFSADYNEYYDYYGYNVKVKDNTLTQYGSILPSIEGIDIVSMEETFSMCQNLIKAPAIPESVRNVNGTYRYCWNLTEGPPKIPNKITAMNYTFQSCYSLAQAPEIPKSVTSLESTFSSCDNLIWAPTLPDGITSLDGTFFGCSGLTEAPKIPDTVTSMPMTFEYCHKLAEIPEIPNSVTSLYRTFENCYGLIHAPVIPSSVRNMAGAFRGSELISGEIIVNSADLDFDYSAPFASGPVDGALTQTGTQGTGLVIIIANDAVREEFINNSGYDSSKVRIVKSRDEI